MKIFLALVVAVLTMGTVGSATAASKDVAVVFNGTSQVNRDTYNFLRRNLGQLNPQVNLVAVQNASSVKPGAYLAVIVLNSGQTSGVDPVLKTFLDGYADKASVFQLNILKGAKTTDVTTISAASNPEGVDAVTSASTWTEGADKMTYIQMHQKWIKVVSDFLKTKS